MLRQAVYLFLREFKLAVVARIEGAEEVGASHSVELDEVALDVWCDVDVVYAPCFHLRHDGGKLVSVGGVADVGGLL